MHSLEVDNNNDSPLNLILIRTYLTEIKLNKKEYFGPLHRLQDQMENCRYMPTLGNRTQTNANIYTEMQIVDPTTYTCTCTCSINFNNYLHVHVHVHVVDVM